MEMQYDYEAVVVGSGFGGAISCCRLAKKWPGQVLLLERGKRYPMGSFPRTPHQMARNLWNIPAARAEGAGEECHGLFDIRNFDHMDAVISAGLGGGSLIYANVFLQPPDEVFDEHWPASIKKDVLQPYYAVAKSVLGARPVPDVAGQQDPRRQILRTAMFQQFAKAEGRESKLLDINVFFGNDFDNPTPIGVQQHNRYGALQTSCVYCAECDVGCNTHSKNTLDLNYLYVAEHRYQAKILTEVLAQKIVPVNASGEDDPTADGQYGYRLYWLDLNDAGHQVVSTLTRRVVVSAGTLGSNELLLQCRDLHKTLPRISKQLGQRFSGNGDFLSFVVKTDQAADPNYGPVITQGTDYNLFGQFDRSKAFILEDASYPNFAAWFTEGLRPGVSALPRLWQTIRLMFDRFIGGLSNGHIGYAVSSMLKGDLSYRNAVLLCMGIDKSDGVMSLDANGNLQLRWPYRNSMSLYQAILQMGERFRAWSGGKVFAPMPNWLWPLRRNVTVHALGGCTLADKPEQGVTSADPATLGQVFGYQGLYVADGSLLPTAVGANPIATICAVSERVAEGITGIAPDDNL